MHLLSPILRRSALLLGPLLACGYSLHADCSLTNLGFAPLPDLAFTSHRGHKGGLYPNGSNQRPPIHELEGLRRANEAVIPRDAAGQPDAMNGRIALVSIGMSNTRMEFNRFLQRADLDPAKNPQLVIVNGAQGGRPATRWTNDAYQVWTILEDLLNARGVNSNQVQILWIKNALGGPADEGDFPAHARVLQSALEGTLLEAVNRFPYLQIAFLSSRTRAYTDDPSTLNPEPYAFESSFSVKWLIEEQIKGGLNYESSRGRVVAPWLAWGPYLWADGANERSDGFVWPCSDTAADFTHPSSSGQRKVADQLMAFLKTDPTAVPWFLSQERVGLPPVCSPVASVTNGPGLLTVSFEAHASDSDGDIQDYQWTFDDGTFSTNMNPVKIFYRPGTYRTLLTVTDDDGNTSRQELPIRVETTYADWTREEFTAAERNDPSISGRNGDPDGDRINNEAEFLLGLQPKVANGSDTGLPKAEIQNGHFMFTFSRFKYAAGIGLQVELSPDIQDWTAIELPGEAHSIIDQGLNEMITVSQENPVELQRAGFVRLRLDGIE